VTTLVITGTGTGVGKTVVTAAIAAIAAADSRRVAVVKPAQTGVAAGEESDAEVVRRLSGVDDVHELVRYAEPLAPASAARRQGVIPVPVDHLAAQVTALTGRDLVLVEGAGGLLVRLDNSGATLADLAVALDAQLLVVAAAALGTLNATALTCEAARRRGLTVMGVVIGAWPSEPDLAAISNLADLPDYAGTPLLGCLSAGAGQLGCEEFLSTARTSLSPALGGTWQVPLNERRRSL
jgi:dethiobiotin synthetase